MTPARKKPDALPSVSNAEWEVLKPLWDHGPLAARDVYAALPAGHGWAIKTVKTLLARLVAKGAIAYEQVGNSYLYRALYSRDQLTREEVRGFVDRVLEGSIAPLLAHFISERKLSEEELARLRDLIEKSGETPHDKNKGGKA
jgi:BlaI family penicillinase repressor